MVMRSPLQSLRPEQLPPWLHRLDCCSSTNSWAIEHPELSHGDVIFTDRQTAGRGQYGRVWHGPIGVLTTSIVVDGISLAQRSGLSLLAGFAVIEAIEGLCPSLQGLLRLKWPNDLWIEGQKLAGILCDATPPSGRTAGRIIVGIGLNRCPDWTEFDPKIAARSTALQDHLPRVPDELAILEQLRQTLLNVADRLRLLQDQDRSALTDDLPRILARDGLRDRALLVDLGTETIAGIGRGFTDQGHLRLELADGRIRVIASGRLVSW
jgi:BirA family transcriptional regulator, biotin operon repressor / biotin---[acetyl-CoA-carboxylase] ligase